MAPPEAAPAIAGARARRRSAARAGARAGAVADGRWRWRCWRSTCWSRCACAACCAPPPPALRAAGRRRRPARAAGASASPTRRWPPGSPTSSPATPQVDEVSRSRAGRAVRLRQPAHRGQPRRSRPRWCRARTTCPSIRCSTGRSRPTPTPPSAAAVAALNGYMANGGIILIDTRRRRQRRGLQRRARTPRCEQVARGLAVPPLAPLTTAHVLARAFYLLQDFPGRFTGDTVWVQRDQDRSNDSVSPVIIGGQRLGGGLGGRRVRPPRLRGHPRRRPPAHAGLPVRGQPGDVRADRQLQGRPGARARRCWNGWGNERARVIPDAHGTGHRRAALRPAPAGMAASPPSRRCASLSRSALALWRRARGTVWRVFAFAVLLLWLAGPRLVEETRETLPDIGLLVVDQTASMAVGDAGRAGRGRPRRASRQQAARAARPGTAHRHRAGVRLRGHPPVRRHRPRAGRHSARAARRRGGDHRRAGARHPDRPTRSAARRCTC